MTKMIKVKDMTRLKAFGFHESINDKYAFAKVVETANDGKILTEAIIAVDYDGILTVEFSPVVPEELFDLQAAGLLERLNEHD